MFEMKYSIILFLNDKIPNMQVNMIHSGEFPGSLVDRTLCSHC